jgi:site-specific DNA recombinase
MNAVIYARVSSKDQEREGYSIPAQLKLLREYAASHDFTIVHEFIDIETAKIAGRTQFGEMIRFLEQNEASRVVIVEKTDRLYRNFRDYVTLEDLDVEIHLPKEGQVISRDSKSQAKLMHGIHVVMARNYIENLREEVRKGMREKAEQGIYPSRPPVGYRNNKLERTIEVDPQKAPIARRMFELYATGRYSLTALGKVLRTEFGISLGKGYLDRLVKNPFYVGSFYWEKKLYKGTQEPLIDQTTYEQVQAVLANRNRPKYRRREFAFGNLLKCAYDDCTVTAEIKRAKYTYYHCTGHRGKCSLPYFREEELGLRLGQILKDIHIPDQALKQIVGALHTDQQGLKLAHDEQKRRLEQRLLDVRRRIDQSYMDKLDGKIPEDFWQRKNAEWSSEEAQIKQLAGRLETGSRGEHVLNATRILELANKAYSLYVSQNAMEQAKLLRMVLSNCAIDAASLYPTYRKPFDLIFQRAKTEEWCARRDSNPRPTDSKSVESCSLEITSDNLPIFSSNNLPRPLSLCLTGRFEEKSMPQSTARPGIGWR